jgi:hypothetical protein
MDAVALLMSMKDGKGNEITPQLTLPIIRSQRIHPTERGTRLLIFTRQ